MYSDDPGPAIDPTYVVKRVILPTYNVVRFTRFTLCIAGPGAVFWPSAHFVMTYTLQTDGPIPLLHKMAWL